MRVRYCATKNSHKFPCDTGWCTISYDKNNLAKTTSCVDDPMEKNCNKIVEVDEIRSYDDMSKTGYEGQEALISGGRHNAKTRGIKR